MPTITSKIDPLVSRLNQRAIDAQVDFLAQGRALISEWLRATDQEGNFELAVDWLLGNGADRYFNDNRELLAVVVMRNAMQLFEIRDSATDDIYQDARNWFEVN